MPINAIIAEMENQVPTTPTESDAPSVEEPSDEPAERFMRTDDMLPPYLHIDTVGGFGTAYDGIGAVLGLLAIIKYLT